MRRVARPHVPEMGKWSPHKLGKRKARMSDSQVRYLRQRSADGAATKDLRDDLRSVGIAISDRCIRDAIHGRSYEWVGPDGPASLTD